jgi:hypothetical protein
VPSTPNIAPRPTAWNAADDEVFLDREHPYAFGKQAPNDGRQARGLRLDPGPDLQASALLSRNCVVDGIGS